MKYLSVAEMQAIERQADASGLSYAQMMEHAGLGLADETYAAGAARGLNAALGLVGPGNNGGDTLVALAHLAARGWQTAAYLARPRPAEDALVLRLQSAGGFVLSADNDIGYAQLAGLLRSFPLLLDGLLGTGFRLPLKPDLAMLLDFVKSIQPQPFVVAVDCPSGVDCDSGQSAAECLPADLTVSMAAVKHGLLKLPAFALLGELRLVGIGLPQDSELPAWTAITRQVVDSAWVRAVLPPRPLDAHKGSFGTALIVAGSRLYSGAALLAGEAAYRIGAGLVTLAVPDALLPGLSGHLLEATWLPLPDDNGFIAAEAAQTVLDNLERPTSLLIGPGLGLHPTTAAFVRRLLDDSPAGMGFMPLAAKPPVLPPLIIDADGLRLLAAIPDWQLRLPPATILTPHPGEMAALTGSDTQSIQSQRLEAVEQLSQTAGCVVVLKGAFTLIAAPDGRTAIIPVATPALARAGTGDVLAGLIAGLRAQGVPAYEAAAAGAWIHAQAGLQAAQSCGNTASVLAGDVLRAVPAVVSNLLNGFVSQAS